MMLFSVSESPMEAYDSISESAAHGERSAQKIIDIGAIWQIFRSAENSEFRDTLGGNY